MFSMQLDADIMPIASSLKEVATNSFNWDGKKDARGRKLLQDIGDVGRCYNPDIWLDAWRLEAWGYDCAIVDDLRFVSMDDSDLCGIRELLYFTSNFPGQTIFIKITGRTTYSEDDKAAQHSTERDIPDEAFDHIIDNSGTKEDLFNAMMEIFNNEKERFIKEIGES